MEDRSIAGRWIIGGLLPLELVVALVLALTNAADATANLYSYANENGDYVISRQRPRTSGEYAVLTDDGEFIELVHPRAPDVPVTHWRPWYLPKQPNPLETPDAAPDGKVIIEEVDAANNE